MKVKFTLRKEERANHASGLAAVPAGNSGRGEAKRKRGSISSRSERANEEANEGENERTNELEKASPAVRLAGQGSIINYGGV